MVRSLRLDECEMTCKDQDPASRKYRLRGRWDSTLRLGEIFAVSWDDPEADSAQVTEE